MKQKMSIGDKLIFMVTGKYPDNKENEEETINNQENKKSAPVDSPESEKFFLEKTHMTKAQAEERIKKWKKNGEDKKVLKGKKLLQEYFGKEGEKKSIQKKLKILSDDPLTAIGVSRTSPDETLPDENDINDDERTFAALSYVPFMAFFVVMVRKDSAFTLFHAWQGVTLIAIIISSAVLHFLLSWLPGIGFLFQLFYFIIFGAMIVAGYTAWGGRYITLPFVTSVAQKLSGR